MSEDEKPPHQDYDRATLVVAATIFVGFCLLVYFLPQLMAAIGGENRWSAGAAIAIILVFPFAGLWLRGRMQRRK